jgi:tetratricopeptide (TPR) repeat protein
MCYFLKGMPQSLPDLENIWNSEDAAASEKVMQDLLPSANSLLGAERSYTVALLAQIARAQGAQGQFPMARATLDEARKVLKEIESSATDSLRIRCLLEASRLSILERIPSQARGPLTEALNLAAQAKEDALSVEASQLMAEIEPPKMQQEWLNRAIQIAVASPHVRVRKYLSSLYTSWGWKLYDVRQFDKAIEVFEKALVEAKATGTEREVFVLRWSIGKVLRALQKTEEALAIQKDLLSQLAIGGARDGRLYEEIAECLLTLKQDEEAKLYFELAYRELVKDQWFVDNESKQLKKMKELGKVKG